MHVVWVVCSLNLCAHFCRSVLFGQWGFGKRTQEVSVLFVYLFAWCCLGVSVLVFTHMYNLHMAILSKFVCTYVRMSCIVFD